MQMKKRDIRKVNSGMEYAEQMKIEACKKAAREVREMKSEEFRITYGVNFITVQTPLVASDLKNRRSIRDRLEAIGLIAMPPPSEFVHVEIKRVEKWPLFIWGVLYLLSAFSSLLFYLFYFDDAYAMMYVAYLFRAAASTSI